MCRDRAIGPGGDNLVVADQDCTDRDLAPRLRESRLFQRQAHEIDIASRTESHDNGPSSETHTGVDDALRNQS